MTDKENRGLAVAAGDGEYVANPLTDLNFIARAEQTDGAMLVLESIAPSGEGPGLRTLPKMDRSTLVAFKGTWMDQSGGCGRFARSPGRILSPAMTMITAPARATKIA